MRWHWRIVCFNVPLACGILEGFMARVPKGSNETAYIDGYSFPRFFIRIFTPLVASGNRGHGPSSCSVHWLS